MLWLKRFSLFLSILFVVSCSTMSSRSPSNVQTCDEIIQSVITRPSNFSWLKKSFERISLSGQKFKLSTLNWISEHMFENSPTLYRGMEELLNKMNLSKAEFDEVINRMPKSNRFKFEYLNPKVKLQDAEAKNYFKKEIVIDHFVSRMQIEDELREEFLHHADESLLSLKQWNDIHQSLGGIERETLQDKQRFQKFVMFLSTLPPKSREEAVQNAQEFFVANPELKQAHLFQKQLHKFEEQRLVLEKKFMNFPGAKRTYEVEKALKTYEKLSLSCRSRGSTMEKQFAAKQGTKFFLGLGLASTTGSYFYNNWDKEHDAKWFGNLGFDITTSFIFTFAYTKILGSNQSGFAGTSLKAYGTFAGLDYLSAEAYSQIFGVSQAEAEERMKKMLENPKAREELSRLKDMLESEKFDDELTKNLETIMQKMEVQNLEEIVADESNRERILEAISLDMYAQEAGDYIRTGDKGLDRYIFHRSYDVIGTPKGIAVGYLIFNTLCRNSANPKVALAKALTIYLADRVTFDYIYYNLRRKAINF